MPQPQQLLRRWLACSGKSVSRICTATASLPGSTLATPRSRVRHRSCLQSSGQRTRSTCSYEGTSVGLRSFRDSGTTFTSSSSSSSSSGSRSRASRGPQGGVGRVRPMSSSPSSAAAEDASSRTSMSSQSPRPQQGRARQPVTKGVVSSMRTVPPHIKRPPYADSGVAGNASGVVPLHNTESANAMRKANQLARRMLDLACSLAAPGVTTEAIDRAVHEAITAAGAYPSPLNYQGFPKSICSSVNEVACHGIPDDRPLQDGDVVSFDVSLYLEGFHGDNCSTIPVGQVDDEGLSLIAAGREALEEGLKACYPGGCISEIGRRIEDFTEREGYGTVRNYCGHGLGYDFHMSPFIQHYRNDDTFRMRAGMIFTIEPIITEGRPEVASWDDGWTVVTADRRRSAQFEHAVLITDGQGGDGSGERKGFEVLTVPKLGAPAAHRQDMA